ncbi:MAG: LCP family protein [Oscillospiraceae bacterium]|nr:LCP family protein [Oscillospiraceae bacterium]
MSKAKRIRRIALIVLGVVAAAVLAATAAWKLIVVPPDVSVQSPGQVEEVVVTPEGKPLPNQQKDPAQQEATVRKSDYYTFLLLGKDTGGGQNTDTMILVSYDVPNGTMNLVNIPRDTMINVSWKIKKINSVYASSRGIEGLKQEIRNLTGVMPDFYVAVEWEAIGEIVDALGGVYFDVPYNMDYDDPYQDLYIHQKKGYRLLDGDDAMQVIRWRKNNGESYGIGDSGRQQVQQNFLRAVAKQCLQIQNWTKVSSFAEIFFKNVETDLPWNSVLWFAQKAMGLQTDSIVFHSLPGNDQGWYYTPSIKSNLAYFFADPAGIVALVNDSFNPFTTDITEKDLQIMYKKADASLGVTNGKLADPDMAIPSVKPTGTSSKPSSDKTETKTDEETLSPPVDTGESSVPNSSEQTEKDDTDDAAVETEEPVLPDENGETPLSPDGSEVSTESPADPENKIESVPSDEGSNAGETATETTETENDTPVQGEDGSTDSAEESAPPSQTDESSEGTTQQE